MRMIWQALMALLLAVPMPAAAQHVAVSAAPSTVSVTVYRNPDRGPDEVMNLAWLGGYALITETRTITIPEGENEIRFEGVAGGIIPQTAIVTELADGVLERNRDARLLSPEGLLDASLGRRVSVRRTNRATGEISETEAVVRSGPDGAVVLETAEGFEALRCSGLPETMAFHGVPEGLSARPTLSVRTRATRAVSAQVTLSYLASGFDWQANYIATIDPDGETLDLFAWVTLANGDPTSFADAMTSTVAGQPNRVATWVSPPSGGPIRLQCWPHGVDLSQVTIVGAQDIVVTGTRIQRADLLSALPQVMAAGAMEAVQEDIGDLKLYRIPERVTVAAQSQKQVAMLTREEVPFERFYRSAPVPYGRRDTLAMVVAYRMQNTEREGLGLPLPLGRAAIFAAGAARPVLIAEASVDDTAIGEEFELEGGVSPQMTLEFEPVIEEGAAEDEPPSAMRVRVSNARAGRARIEIPIAPVAGPRVARSSEHLVQHEGVLWWRDTVPANGTATLTYVLAPD